MDSFASNVNNITNSIALFSTETWATLLAIVIGPFLAIVTDRWMARKDKEHERRMFVYSELMLTRDERASKRHGKAINMVRLVFHKNSDKKVISAFEDYFQTLGYQYPATSDPSKWDEKFQQQLAHQNKCFVDLLFEISRRVKHCISREQIATEIFLPHGAQYRESRFDTLMEMLLEYLRGSRALSIHSIVERKDEYERRRFGQSIKEE